MLGARPVGRATSFAKKSERCSTRPSPRVKMALLRGRRPTLAPDWIGFLAFRESFELPLGAILTPTLFLLGARAGTNAKGRFCKARTNLCCGSIEPLSSGEPNVVFRRILPIPARSGGGRLTE